MDEGLAATSVAGTPSRLRVERRSRVQALGWPFAADAWAAVGLLGASVLFYYPLVFLGRSLVDYDALVYFYPQRIFLARSLLSGHIPLWDPYLFLGAPFLANPQTAVLYPPSWLFLFGPVQAVYAAQLVLHAFLAAFFTYLLARHAFGVLPLAAAVGGLAFAFGGFAVGQVGHLNQLSAAAWLPAVLFAYQRFAATRRPHWIGLGALALGMQLLAGHPQETYMTLIGLGIFGGVTAPWRSLPHLGVCIVGGAAVCLLGAGLAAAQLAPTLELAPLSIRGEGVSWRDAVAGSLPSYLAVRALLPPYWIRVPYTEYLGYVGVTTVTLGLLAIMRGRLRPVVFGVLLTFLGVFLALGENNDWYARLFASVPGFDTFRVPARWLLLWAFGAALLASLGADWIGRGSTLRARSFWLLPRVAATLFVVGYGLYWQIENGEPFSARRTPLAFAAIALLILLIACLPRLGRPVLAASLLVVVTGGELWAAADATPARQAPPPAFTQGESVDWLRSHGVTDQERVLSLARPEYVPASDTEVRTALSDLPESQILQVLVAQKWHDTLTPNVPLQYGLNTPDGYDGGVLPLLRWLHLSGIVVQSPRPDGVLLTRLDGLPPDRLLDLLGVRYLVSNDNVTGRAGMEMVDFGDLHLYARAAPVPLSLVVFRVTPVPNEGAALARIARPDFDSNYEVLIESTTQSSVLSPQSSAADPIPIQPDFVAAERWHAHVSLPQAGYLLQREAWYPGWHARVDGVDAPLLRADSLFRAVLVGAGEHDVEFYFESPSFLRGAFLSLGALVVIIVLFGWRAIIRTRVQGKSRTHAYSSR